MCQGGCKQAFGACPAVNLYARELDDCVCLCVDEV